MVQPAGHDRPMARAVASGGAASRRARRWATAAVVLSAGLVLPGCLEPTFGYLSKPDAGFALRYPRRWDELPTTPTGTEWVRAVDAAEHPSPEHIESYAVDAPVLLAQVLPLGAAEADTYTLARLRQLAHPERLDPTAVTDGSVRVHLDEPVLTDDGFEGHHLRFDLVTDGADTVRVEHFAVLAPDRATVYRVRVACRVACFERNADDIADIFDSIDLDG